MARPFVVSTQDTFAQVMQPGYAMVGVLQDTHGNVTYLGERLVADYAGTGLTVGRHPLHYRRSWLQRQNVLSASELCRRRDGEIVRAAGCIIARQRPGTAKGFIFLSMEDETGIANVIVTPDLYERQRLIVTRSKFLIAEGPLQNQDGVIHVKATNLIELSDHALATRSHDFH
jgi:error-prone DNA polymerase